MTLHNTRETYDGQGNLIGTETVEYPPEVVNADQIQDQLLAAFVRLRQIRTQMATITGSTGTLTGAQLSTAVRTLAGAVDDVTRVEVKLLRERFNQFDDVD